MLREFFHQNYSGWATVRDGSGVTVGFGLITWADVGSIYQLAAGGIGALILFLTFANALMEFKHKWRRERHEQNAESKIKVKK